MLTIDHIIPISKGDHKTSVKNLQPMLSEINNFKDNELISNEKLKEMYNSK